MVVMVISAVHEAILIAKKPVAQKPVQTTNRPTSANKSDVYVGAILLLASFILGAFGMMSLAYFVGGIGILLVCFPES